MINLQPDGPARRIRHSLVLIWGQRTLLYEALAQLLEMQVCQKCIITNDLATLQREIRSGEKHKVVLIDALERDFEKSLAELVSLEGWDSASVAVALFNMMNGHSVERKAFLKGASGFFYRQDSLQTLLNGLDALLQGEAWIPHRLLTEIALHKRGNGAGSDGANLTKREMDVLGLVASGASNEQIGDKLCISPHTVKTHMYNVFKKLQVPNRLQAALWAEKNL